MHAKYLVLGLTAAALLGGRSTDVVSAPAREPPEHQGTTSRGRPRGDSSASATWTMPSPRVMRSFRAA